MNAIERMRARARRTAWWSDRWAWRGALAAAPLGAMAAILHALLVLRTGWEEALVLYAVGGMVAAGIGCLLAGPLGGAVQALRNSRAAARRRRTGTPPSAAPPAEQDLDSMLHGPRATAA